jgi:hypothetical protein
MAAMRHVSHNGLSKSGAMPPALARHIAATTLRVTPVAGLRQPRADMLTGSAQDLKRLSGQRE